MTNEPQDATPASGTDQEQERPPVRALGLCWFKRKTFQDDRMVMADPEELFETYDEWLKSAVKLEAQARAAGAHVLRVPFDRTGFIEFCDEEGIARDAQARARWAAVVAKTMGDIYFAEKEELLAEAKRGAAHRK